MALSLVGHRTDQKGSREIVVGMEMPSQTHIVCTSVPYKTIASLLSEQITSLLVHRMLQDAGHSNYMPCMLSESITLCVQRAEKGLVVATGERTWAGLKSSCV